ncbi:MAG TPA: helix-turn-helix transcriptional regulator, partial [Fodinibius sp.]|nr:helix-turn-helix transcriptional regulator [Fodinibius sp.]
SALNLLLQIEDPNRQVQTILNNNTTFFFHECMTPDIQRVFKKLFWNNNQDKLPNLFYQIKIQELIYLLFSQLLCRENAQQYPINNEDIKKLNEVHFDILEDISEPPDLSELAQNIGMSKTKMKQLFKQIYGDSIYNYYLNARMEDAAYLLKHANLSVSEVGHQVGYSNMSHFSRMFQKHYGTNPKNYISVG